MFRYKSSQSNQSGQTLIETMVAVFVLVMGITAALGLANYSLNTTTGIRKQIIGMGLAREGIEAVKNMRDTNWLQSPLETNCYNFSTGDSNAPCYPYWLDPTAAGYNGYNINTDKSTEYRLVHDASQADIGYWALEAEASNRFGLEYDPSSEYSYGLYYPGVIKGPRTHAEATSDYARKITISIDDSFAPFDDKTIGPRVKVTSQVWWKDKNCPASDNVPQNNKCTITLETYLTNWKNY